MEESEKRKERLNAIRMEAAEPQNFIEEPLVHGLTNPLIESPLVSFEQRPRFDYYTNPMAAFSQQCNTQKWPPDAQSIPRSEQCNTPPSPMDAHSPAYRAQGNYTSGRRPYQPRGVNAIPLGIRRKTSSFCTSPGNSSDTLDSSPGTPTNYFPPNSPQVGDFASDGFPQGGGSDDQYVQGSSYQGSRFRGSPYQGSGRGRGGLKCYYNKSMVEDPWEQLKPVIWKPRDFPKFIISTKKAKLEETPTKSTPQQSLAEYLAAAFNEAAGTNTVNDDSST